MKNTYKKTLLFFALFFAIIIQGQSQSSANDKIIADTLKLSTLISTQKAELAGLGTTLFEENAKLEVLVKEKETLKSQSQESAQKVQSISENADTEKDAQKLKKQSKSALKNADQFKKAISNHDAQVSRIEKIKYKQEKLMAAIQKNEKKQAKLKTKLK